MITVRKSLMWRMPRNHRQRDTWLAREELRGSCVVDTKGDDKESVVKCICILGGLSILKCRKIYHGP